MKGEGRILHLSFNTHLDIKTISRSVDAIQKGVITIQRFFVENQKGAIAIDFIQR